jgi:hypothetical protein
MDTFTLHTVVLHDDTRASNDLARIAFLVDLAQAGPSTQDLCVTDFYQMDLVLSTQSLDKFYVFGFGTSLDENTKVSLTFVKSLGAFAETSRKSVMNKGIFQNLLYGIVRK